jgi:hypothetical protein
VTFSAHVVIGAFVAGAMVGGMIACFVLFLFIERAAQRRRL